jgi:hypothetical protein
MFSNIHWVLGARPKLLNGDEIVELDCVAETCLESPAFGRDVQEVNGIIIILDHMNGLEYENTFSFTSSPFISCWDFIEMINECVSNLEVQISFIISSIRVENGRILLTCE